MRTQISHVYAFELDASDGRFYVLAFGRRSRGFRTHATESEARAAIADMIEGDRQNDEADAIYSRLYRY